MTTRALRRQVAAAIESSWPEFTQNHPMLSRVVDEELLEDYVFDSLADDSDFVSAYRHAVDQSVGPTALAMLVESFVKPTIKRII